MPQPNKPKVTFPASWKILARVLDFPLIEHATVKHQPQGCPEEDAGCKCEIPNADGYQEQQDAPRYNDEDTEAYRGSYRGLICHTFGRCTGQIEAAAAQYQSKWPVLLGPSRAMTL